VIPLHSFSEFNEQTARKSLDPGVLNRFGLAGLLFAGLLLAGCGKTLPSVVFITVDTLRADHLGCYG